MLVAAHTLGCKVNKCDTDALLESLASIGCIICNFNQVADIYIINTCTVTHTSDKKSKQMMRRAKRQNPNALVAVCGCMVRNTHADTFDADYVFDARKPEDFVVKIAELNRIKASQPYKHNNVEPDLQSRTRAFVKIQDGCDRFCAYCIVPYVRGNPKSRHVQDIIIEVGNLILSGAQEIVLTGIQVASYGEDTKDATLSSLISQLLAIDNLKRLRLSSIEPCAINEEFLAVVASSQVLCAHFHLSLQSGSDATLKRMNRRYTSLQYASKIKALRTINPNIALTTDIIVGFPGETDEEFDESLKFVQEMGFSRIHVFEYSMRAGTVAATLPSQVPDQVKSERGLAMRAVAAKLQRDFYRSQIGKKVPVLFETEKKLGQWVGYTSNYCPVEINIKTNNKQNLTNTIVEVEITASAQDGLVGKIGGCL